MLKSGNATSIPREIRRAVLMTFMGMGLFRFEAFGDGFMDPPLQSFWSADPSTGER
jgi:hypothetical protein